MRTEERFPPPVRAGIGLIATGVDRARHVDLAGLATLPMRGLGLLVKTRDTVERTYEELSNRGETVIARWRGRPEPRQTSDAVPRTTPDVIDVTDPYDVADANATPGATLAHDELPLDDYDHLTLGSLRARLPKLDTVSLVQLLDYERVHANRLPVVTLLQNRLAKVGANGTR